MVTHPSPVIASTLDPAQKRSHPVLRFWLLCCVLLLPTLVVGLPLWAAPAAQTPPQVAVVQKANSTVQRIRNRGNVLIVGILYDYKPFGFLDEKGAVAGFDVDLARALAAQWEVEVQFVPVTPSTRLQSLMAGQVDLVAAALPHTAAGEAAIDFSVSYFTDQPSLLVRADGPVSLNALAGRVVAAVQGDTALAQLQLTLDQSETALTILPFQEYAPALMALRAGQADALLGHSVQLAQMAQENLGVSLILPIDGSVAFALGIAPGDAHFRALVDATLQQLQENGTYAAIYRNWFPDQPPFPLATLPGKWPYTLATLPATLDRPAPSRLGQLRARGKLLVGVPSDLPPFGSVDASGEISGFDVAIAQELARRWFGDATALDLVRVSADTAIPLLQAGQVDLIVAALPHTWANEPEIDFSISYFVDRQRLLVRADSLITELADLRGRTIATVAGAEPQTSVVARLAENGLTAVNLLPFQEHRSAEQALIAGQVDALLGSSVVFSGSIQTNADLQMLPILLDRQPYAIGIGQFDDELRDLVNITLQAMQADGTYAAIYRRWFTDSPYQLTTWSGVSAEVPNAGQTPPPARTVTTPTITSPLTTSLVLTSTLTAAEATAVPALGNATRTTILIPTATPVSVTMTVTARATVANLVPTVTATATVTTPLTATPPLSTTLSLSTSARLTARSALSSTSVLTSTADLTATTTPTNPVATNPRLVTTPTAPGARLPVATATTVLTPTLPTTVTVLGTLNLNVRTRPAPTAPILMVLPGNTQWPVIAVTADGEWVQLRLSNGLQGWVLRTLLVEAAAFPTPVPSPTPVPTPTTTPVILLLMTPTVTSGTVAADGSTQHRVTATDTLATIAQQYYGQQGLWTLIYNANRELIGADPNAIPVGVELIIPPRP